MTRLIRLVVTLATAAGLLAALVGGIAYSSSRFFHDFASTREEPLPCSLSGPKSPR